MAYSHKECPVPSVGSSSIPPAEPPMAVPYSSVVGCMHVQECPIGPRHALWYSYQDLMVPRATVWHSSAGTSPWQPWTCALDHCPVGKWGLLSPCISILDPLGSQGTVFQGFWHSPAHTWFHQCNEVVPYLVLWSSPTSSNFPHHVWCSSSQIFHLEPRQASSNNMFSVLHHPASMLHCPETVVLLISRRNVGSRSADLANQPILLQLVF